MALRGSLSDMSIIDLVQFPHKGRKSGVLIIASPEDNAKLYYDAGNLIHAVAGEVEGHDALTSLVDWEEGEFEFRTGHAGTQRRSIEIDLHRAVMQALKTRDEIKARETSATEEIAKRHSIMKQKFQNFVVSHPFTAYIGAVGSDGKALVEAVDKSNGPEEIESLKRFVKQIIDTEPRAGFGRMIIEDDRGIVVISKLGRESRLLVVAREGATLGAAAVAVARFTADLAKKDE